MERPSEERDDDEDSQIHVEACIDDPDEFCLVPVPPDGGFGWVIVIASFLANTIVDGIAYSFGVFFKDISTSLNCSESETAMVGSFLSGIYLLVGPIVSGLVNKFGSRPVMIFGSFLASLAFFICYFSPNVLVLTVTYGFFGGIGFGLIYLPAIVHVGYYFEKKRALATGLAVAGSGFGTFLFAPLSVWLLEEYGGWRGANWLMAGFVLNCAILGCFMRPLKPKKMKRSAIQAESGQAQVPLNGSLPKNLSLTQLNEARQRLITQLAVANDSRIGSISSAMNLAGQAGHRGSQKMRAAGDATDRNAQSPQPLSSNTSLTGRSDSLQKAVKPTRFRSTLSESAEKPERTAVSPTPSYPGAAVDQPDSPTKLLSPNSTATDDSLPATTRPRDASFTGLSAVPEGEILQTTEETTPKVAASGTFTVGSTKDLSAAKSGGLHPPPLLSTQESTYSSKGRISRAESRLSQAGIGAQHLTARSYADSIWRLASVRSPSETSLNSTGAASALAINPEDFARPMYRRDILYAGSVKNLPEFRESHGNVAAYLDRTTSIPGRQLSVVNFGERQGEVADGAVGETAEIIEADQTVCGCIPQPMMDTLMEMCDVRLLRIPFMALYCISNIFSMLAFYIPFVYLGNRAKERGVSDSDASLLLSIIGITNTFGRIFFGWFSDRHWISALNINNLCLMICGLMTVFLSVFNSYALMVLYSVIFGFFISAHISLTSIILVDYLGLEKLTNSFGLLILFRGVSALAGSPLGGKIYDVTKSYDNSFQFAGVLLIGAAIISGLIPFVDRIDRWWHEWRHRQKTKYFQQDVKMAREEVAARQNGQKEPHKVAMKKISITPAPPDLPPLVEELDEDKTLSRLDGADLLKATKAEMKSLVANTTA